MDALQAYEEERQLYEDALQEERELICANEFMRRKVETLREKAAEVGYMGEGISKCRPCRCASTIADSCRIFLATLSERAQHLSTQIPVLQSHLAVLLNTPSPAPRANAAGSSSGEISTTEPWGTTRASYINWASAAQVKALPVEERQLDEDAMITTLAANLQAKGTQADAQVSLKCSVQSILLTRRRFRICSPISALDAADIRLAFL